MKKNVVFILLVFSSMLITLYAQQTRNTVKGTVQFRTIDDVYIEVASIGFITDTPWLDCTEQEPFDSGNTWKTSGDYDIYKLVKGTRYHIDPLEGVEFFWFNGACAGKEICIDDNNRSSIAPGGTRIKVPNVNVSYTNNGVWMDFCNQCQDCNDSVLPSRGRWWKYNAMFFAGELEMNTTSGTALQMNLQYQMLVNCTWQTNYGCDDGEST